MTDAQVIEAVKKAIGDGCICYAIDRGDYLGGAGNHLLRHAMISRKLGVNIVVAIPLEGKDKNEIIERICIKYDLRYCFCNYTTAYDFKYIDGDNVKEHVKSFIYLAKKYNIKLFHSVQLNPAAEMAGRIIGIPHIMSIYQIDKSVFSVSYPNIFAQYVHSDSNLYAKIWGDGLKAKTVCIRSYIPSNFEKISEEGIDIGNRTKVTLAVVGTVCKRKSQHKIIEVIGLLKEKNIDINLIILGYFDVDKPYREKCENLIEKYKINDRVIIKGFCSDVPSELKKVDGLVCVSNDESFPQVILEAMAMNIPVISTPVAGVPELIENNETGYLAKDFSTLEILKTIEGFINDNVNDKMLINKIVENAKNIVVKESSFSNVAGKLYNFYYRAITDDYSYSSDFKNIDLLMKYYFDFGMVSFAEKMKQFLNTDQIDFMTRSKFGIVYIVKYLKELYEDKVVDCYIWGAGTAGKVTKEVVKATMANFNICGFIDKFKDGAFEGFNIYKPHDIEYSEKRYIFVATGPGKDEAFAFLNSKGLEINNNYISIFN